MTLHYSKHHQTYINNLNLAVEQLEKAQQKGDLLEVAALENILKFNLGGHLNHSLFWSVLSPTSQKGGILLEGSAPLSKAVTQQFGGYQALIQELSKRTVAVQVRLSSD